ncbi:hypothetical protein MCBMB27_02095 [Methylobacterium phyllosphaerae]|uniref:FoF1-type ATP synthase, membrane subunit b or b n=1 Tax=Methylobacterium phyllosphaerae TaxID=418223 RepID=A0AAE8HQ42_9HYPH|nr:hypothetical protein [Methylobacterium phyllosphaerae]APT31386.1 hypothetical protein MCBMB27_02095 [Methylobacterium phyllosphaerae]SFG64391.1 FoF1-type ATP synthase, membrane subunit b or b' [Methylobacterium phyllosphaerae]
MIRALKALLGLAQREDATADELAPSLPAAEAELSAAREAQAAAEAAYRAGLLTADEKAPQLLDGARRDAGMRVERAEALVETLRERLAEAQDREAEAERVAVYQAARAEADDARRALAELYPQLAADLVQLMELVARAEVEVEAANADLPRGVEPLAGVEHPARDVPAEADEVLSEVEVKRWVAVGNVKPGTFEQGNVYKTGPGRGVIRIEGVPVNECTQVELRTFTERRFQRGRGHISAYRLAEKISLPGFLASDPYVWRPMSSLSKPGEVIGQVEALRYARPGGPALASGAIITQLIPAPGAERVQALPAAPPTQPYRGPYADAPENEARA